MAGARLCPLVQVLMLMLVLVLVLVPVQALKLVPALVSVLAGWRCSQGMPWWDDSAMSECLFTPNVTSAERMECDYSGVPFAKVTFRGGQIPSTVRAIWLSNAMQITISPDTFSHLEDLQLINISSIRALQIARNNWTRVEHPQNVLITIEHVPQVIFDSQAFSGWSEPGPEITVRNITRLYIRAFAFDSGSVIRKITIGNVDRLWLKRGSFHASTEELNLHNVLLPEGCHGGSFGGDIGSLSLVSVQMRAVHSGCIQTSDAGWSRLEVRSSSLGDIEHRGISGNISDVVLDDTHIDRVRAGGLRVDVASFHMSGCAVKELAPRALDVRFTRSALLQTSLVQTSLLIAAPSSLLLLLILSGVLLVLLKRRRSRRRAGRQLDDVHISNCSRQPAEALYAQIADIAHRHSPSTSPSAMERRCKHYWRRQRADRPELPPPREADPVYVEMAPRRTVAPRATAGSRKHGANSRHPHDGRQRVYENLHLVGRRTPLASVSPFVTPVVPSSQS